MRKRANNTGSVSRIKTGRNKGKWVGTWTVRSGARKYVYADTQAAVLKKLEQLREREAAHLPAKATRQTVGQYLDAWVSLAREDDNLRERVRRDYALIVEKHIKPAIGGINLEELNSLDVERMLNKKRRELSASRVNQIHSVLSKALKPISDHGPNRRIEANWARLAPRKKGAPVVIETPTTAQRDLFLSSWREHRLYPLFVLAFYTGARQGELLALQWEDYDEQTSEIHIRRTLHRIDGQPVLGRPKTDESIRSVPVLPESAEALRLQKIRQAEWRLKAGQAWQDSSYVFTNAEGHPLSGSNVTHEFQKALETVGLPKFHFHAARHCFATTLVARQADHATISKLLGHSQVSTTMSLYVSPNDSMKRAAIAKLSETAANL